MNRSKEKKIRREIHAFEQKFSPKIVADWCGRRSGFSWRCRSSRIGSELALILLQSEPRSRHDRATIASIVMLVLKRSPSESVGRIVLSIPRWRSRDCGSIALRSRFDRATIVDFFHESSPPSDGNLTLHASRVKRRKSGFTVAVRSRLCGLHVDEDTCSSCRHTASDKPFDHRHLNYILRTC